MNEPIICPQCGKKWPADCGILICDCKHRFVSKEAVVSMLMGGIVNEAAKYGIKLTPKKENPEVQSGS